VGLAKPPQFLEDRIRDVDFQLHAARPAATPTYAISALCSTLGILWTSIFQVYEATRPKAVRQRTTKYYERPAPSVIPSVAQSAQSRDEARGTRHEARGTRHEARGTRHEAQGTSHPRSAALQPITPAEPTARTPRRSTPYPRPRARRNNRRL
jgi:hypothetical protein